MKNPNQTGVKLHPALIILFIVRVTLPSSSLYICKRCDINVNNNGTMIAVDEIQIHATNAKDFWYKILRGIK